MAGGRRLIAGLGNPLRGDDGVGHAALARLHGRVPEGVELVRLTGEASTLLECIQGAEVVFLIDAARSGAPPGMVRRFDVSARALPSGLADMSSHGLGLAHAIELARALQVMPRKCIVFAIEGATFEHGAPLSHEAEHGAGEVAERILGELGSPADGKAGEPMHEASLMKNLVRRIDEVAKAEGAMRVAGIKVWCGAQSHMSREHFALHFAQAAAGTIAEGALLDVTVSEDLTDPRAHEVVLESVDIEA